MKILECECPACSGTGIYVGMGERDGAGIVCHQCKGTGMYKYEYTPFTERKKNSSIKIVLKTNPGICVGGKLEAFGGMPYEAWFSGEPFPEKSEMRKYTCPNWWLQSAEGRHTGWKECRDNAGRSFSQCSYFGVKESCWEKYDEEKSK